MRERGLTARRRKSYRTTKRFDERLVHAENLLARNFSPDRMNSVWATDIAYTATAEGWLCLAVVVDHFSRKMIGWTMSMSISTELVLEALRMDLVAWQAPRGLIVHSDRGEQYASRRYLRVLHARGLLQSMSRKGDCWDNACVGSFFKTLKVEFVGSTTCRTRKETQTAIFEFIEVFCSRIRLHSTLASFTPEETEAHAG